MKMHLKIGVEKKTVEIFPNLATDIIKIAEQQTQTDPQFKTTHTYTRLSATSIREQLISEEFNYTNETLATMRTISKITNSLGYRLKSVLKTVPLKKIPETNAIFNNLKIIHKIAEKDDSIVRLSIDAKDRVKIGNFSREGKNRLTVEALDHDFGDKYITPFGILDIKTGAINISIAHSKITADYIVDRLEETWISSGYAYVKHKLVLSSDNGPENSSHRTQFIKRIVDFSIKYDVIIYLAYYPPYHSKYNPIERVWGRLEAYWNGSLLNTVEAVVGFARNMTYNKIHPVVTEIKNIYKTGIKLKIKVMKIYEKAIQRIGNIGKWYVIVDPIKCKRALTELVI